MRVDILLLFIVVVIFGMICLYRARVQLASVLGVMASDSRVVGGDSTVDTDAEVNAVIKDIKDFADSIHKCLEHINMTGFLADFVGVEFPATERVGEITKTIAYKPTRCLNFTTIHNGQLKLLINEVQFYNRAYKIYHDSTTSSGASSVPRERDISLWTAAHPSESRIPQRLRPVFVYCGSAPNNKGSIINAMFPSAVNVLVDPAEHLIRYGKYMGTKTHYNTLAEETIYISACTGSKFGIPGRLIYLCEPAAGSPPFKIARCHRKNATADVIESLLPRVIEWARSATVPVDGIDPRKVKNIIVETYFNNDIATKIAPLVDFFLSDIRTNIADGRGGLFSEEYPSDLDVSWNNASVLRWVTTIAPKLSMLKMRFPYFNKGDPFLRECHKEPYASVFRDVRSMVDFVADYKARKCNYIAGEDFTQAFAGTTSGESRLVFSDIRIIPVDYLAREQKLFYYNLTQRQFAYHGGYRFDPVLGIDACGDCALMTKVFSEYVSHCSVVPAHDPSAGLTFRDRALGLLKSLVADQHGVHYTPFSTLKDIELLQYTVMTNVILDRQIQKHWRFKSADMDLNTVYNEFMLWKNEAPKFVDRVIKTYPEALAPKGWMKDSQKIYDTARRGTTNTLKLMISSRNHCAKFQDFVPVIAYIFQGAGYKKSSALQIIKDWFKIIGGRNTSPAIATKEDFGSYLMVKYRDFEMKVTKENHFATESAEEICRALLFDSYRVTEGSGFIVMDPRAIAAIAGRKVIEISMTICDRMIWDTTNLAEYTHVTFLTTPGAKTLEEVVLDDPTWVIVINVHSLKYYYLWLKKFHRGLMIGVAQYTAHYKPVVNGYSFSTPYIATTIDGDKSRFWADVTRYYVHGPTESVQEMVAIIETNFGSELKK